MKNEQGYEVFTSPIKVGDTIYQVDIKQMQCCFCEYANDIKNQTCRHENCGVITQIKPKIVDTLDYILDFRENQLTLRYGYFKTENEAIDYANEIKEKYKKQLGYFNLLNSCCSPTSSDLKDNK